MDGFNRLARTDVQRGVGSLIAIHSPLPLQRKWITSLRRSVLDSGVFTGEDLVYPGIDFPIDFISARPAISDKGGAWTAQSDGVGQHGKFSSFCSSAEHSARRTWPVHKRPRRGKANRRTGHRTETEGPRRNPTRIAAAPVPRAGECKVLAARRSSPGTSPARLIANPYAGRSRSDASAALVVGSNRNKAPRLGPSAPLFPGPCPPP